MKVLGFILCVSVGGCSLVEPGTMQKWTPEAVGWLILIAGFVHELFRRPRGKN
jgi:hypothetical protein